MSTLTSQGSRELKATDRCDSCGAQAFVIAEFMSGELMFCGHHYHRWEAKIAAGAINVIDQTNLINERPSASSN